MSKVYRRPEVKEVKLSLEEVLLTGCKLQVPGHAGPQMQYCGGSAGTWYGMCADAGS